MIYVKYDERKRRLIVQCGYGDNYLVKQFPSRRFNPKHKHWEVTMCRKNVEHLRKITADAVDISPAAAAKIDAHMVKTDVPPTIPFPVSYNFKTDPFPQQRDALALSWNKSGFALFMEMGTGKSKVAIDKATNHFMQGDINGMIVWCPVSIRTNWIGEFRTHCPLDLKWKIVDGMPVSPYIKVCDLSTKALERELDEFIATPMPFKVLIVGMESVQQGSAVDDPKKAGRAYAVAERFALAHNHIAVVDEAHGIKGHDSNRTVNITKLGLMAKFKLLMTGTPVLQGLLDLYSYFEFLDPNIIGMGDWYSFRARYAILSDDGYNRVVAYDNTEELLSTVQPYIYQVLKSECMSLPPKMYAERVVKLSAAQKEVYDKIKKTKEYEKGDVKVSIDNALQKYSALQTVIGGFLNYDEYEEQPSNAMDINFAKLVSEGEDKRKKRRATMPIVDWRSNPKISELLQCLQEIGDKEQVIIWTVHTYELLQVSAALRHKYGDSSVVDYYGGVDLATRDAGKSRFNAGHARFFNANQYTGGVGLTLNEASYVFYLSHSFKLKDRLQSEDRNHRIGQTKSVLYTTIIAAGTVDHDIMSAIRDKKDFADWVKDQFATGNGRNLGVF